MKFVVEDSNPVVTRGPTRSKAVDRNIWVLGSSRSEFNRSEKSRHCFQIVLKKSIQIQIALECGILFRAIWHRRIFGEFSNPIGWLGFDFDLVGIKFEVWLTVD